MADNPKFNNSNMFTGKETDTTHNDINPDNNSEVLATQGNVISSIKVFWNRLRAKLKYAVTRESTSSAVGTEYIPVYVDENGEVKQCNCKQIPVSDISNNNIDIGNISPIPGTTLSLKVTVDNNSTNLLTIYNKKVLYPTGVEVNAKIDANTNLLVVYNGEIWILINKMNEVKASNKSTENGNGNGGNPGLMTADDKAKLNTIDWDANNYTLPTASTTTKGGVQLGAGQLINLPTPNSSNTNGRYYPIQTDKDNKLVVNVPWTDNDSHDTAKITVGTQDTTNNNSTNGTQLTYINIIDNKGDNKSHIIVKGNGDTTVSSTESGELVISSPTVPSYGILNSSNNNSSSGHYLIYGPGKINATTNYFLAGNGTWVNGKLVPIPTEEGKTLKSHSNGTVYWG